MKEHFGCPVQATSNVFAGKWKVLIVWHLGFGPRRFAELRHLLPGVLARTVSSDVPPHVEYSLTAAGCELIPVMEKMCAWGTTHLGVPPSLPPRNLPVAI